MTKSRMSALPRMVAASALALAIAGPAFAQEMAAPPNPEEIARQADLTPMSHDAFELFQVRPGTDLSRFRQIMLAPIEVAIDRDRRELQLDDRTVRHAKREFAEELGRALGAQNLTEAPGPGVARLDITVTEFMPNNPPMPERRFGGIIDESIGIGRAAFQAVITDTASGEVVAVIADADVGLPFGSNLSLHTMYGDADRFVKRWSRQIAETFGMRRGS